MTGHLVAAPRPEVLDPDSPAGRRAADALSDFEAEVITRLRREGKPIPAGRPDPTPVSPAALTRVRRTG